MKQYHIHHSTGINKFEEVEHQPRVYAGFVEANSLDEAYSKSQNGGIHNQPNSWSLEALPWNTLNPCRSTSIGDVIQDDDNFHMVCGIGFQLLVES